jgi:hypothetical protein
MENGTFELSFGTTPSKVSSGESTDTMEKRESTSYAARDIAKER